ncbi:GAF and ANTAR domain-containing protein [Arthrobacter sp. Z1-15]
MEHQPTPPELPESLIEAILASQDVKGFLEDIAVLASRELSQTGEAVHCAITLIRPSGPRVIASSTETARQADEMQCAFGEGPCLHAATTGKVVEVNNFQEDQRWPVYCREAAGYGIGAVLAVPVSLPGRATCAINVYSAQTHEFSDREVSELKRFAAQASAAVQLAIRIADMQKRSEDLMAAMSSRTVIDIAIGIIMGQSKCSQDAAFNILRAASSHRNQKLHEVAAKVVTSVKGGTVETHFA